MNICRVVRAVSPAYYPTTLRASIGYRLAMRGHNIYVVANRFLGQPIFEKLPGGMKVYRVKAHVIPEIRYPLTYMGELLRVLRGLIVKYDIDVIHYHPFEYPICWSALLIRDVPKVISIEGVPGLNWFYGRLLVDLAGLGMSITIGRAVLSACSRIIVFGKSIVKYVRALGIPEQKIAVIGYGVDEEKFDIDMAKAREEKRAELGLSEDDVIALFVGRLYPVKGVRFLLEASSLVSSRRPDVKFIIVGDGSLRPLVEETVKRNPNVIYLGYRTDVPELMAASDIFVLPSLAEGLPYALLEAGYCGLPVVATNVGCVPDVVIPGWTGFLVPKGSGTKLAEAVLELVERPELREEMSKNIRALVRRRYSWNNVLYAYERLYEEVIEERG